MAKVTVIGIGARPLDGRAARALSEAEVVIGPARLVEVFRGYAGFEEARGKIREVNGAEETMAFVRLCIGEGRQRLVLLASGDPLFFGIGRRAVADLGSDVVEVIPDVSSMQLAFSRIGEPWDEAALVSLHGRPDARSSKRRRHGLEDLPGLLRSHGRLALLTDREHGPAAIAASLAQAAFQSPPLVHVFERLGYEDERITHGRPEEIAAMSFNEPNVVIVTTTDGPPPADTGPRLGLREEELAHSAGLITKDEVRAVALHALRLPEKGVFWDIGAGSGAVSCEASRLCPGLRVFAVEKDEAQRAHIRENDRLFGRGNLIVAAGEAPDVLSGLPAPDRVFIGGSGGRLAGIVAVLGERMEAGIVVVNASTLETLAAACTELEKAGFPARVSEVSVARSRPVGEKRYMAALNPVFIITGERR